MTELAARPAPDTNVVPAVWSRITNLRVDRGEGSWLITTDGERYLDYTSGIGVTNTGHAHPRVVAAVQEQAAKLLHGQQNILYHEAGLRLYERLRHVLPGDGWGAFLSNSGAEAVEAAVKLARIATGRPVILGFRYGYHGRAASITRRIRIATALRAGPTTRTNIARATGRPSST
jgi:4-aminobutyrate aminotransferase